MNVRGSCAALLGVLLLAAPSCGGTSAPAGPSSADIQRFVAVKETTDELTHVIVLISTADGTLEQLGAAPAGSAEARRLLSGARIGWNNVIVGLQYFTPRQAAVVPGLARTVLGTRRAAIAWTNAIDALRRASRGGPSSAALRRSSAGPRRDEAAAKRLIGKTAGTLARLACSLERAYPELVPKGAPAHDCGAAGKLAQS